MLLLLLAGVTVTTAFEGGSLGRVERIAANHLRCSVKGQADQNNRNRQANWYYFRLDGLPEGEFTIDLVDLVGEYNFRPGSHAVTRNTRPVYSYDDRTWTHFTGDQTSWDEKEVRLSIRFKPGRRTIWIAHTVPYTKRDLDKLLALRHPDVRIETIGRSVRAREIPLLTITARETADAGKKVVWLMARQHAWETGTSWVADGLVRFLLSSSEEAARIRRIAVFKIIPMFDPDGVAEGTVRFNLNGYDNNRNWDTVDPLLMPEIAVARGAIYGWLDSGRPIDIFLAMHNTESVDYVEGPTEGGGPAIRSLAENLVKQLRERTSFHDPSSPRNSMGRGPIEKGRMTVNQALFAERKVPAFLMELMVESHPILGRPRTAQDFSDFGAGLARSLATAVAR